jgi:uncharacterized protein YidB (DUF937 family)
MRKLIAATTAALALVVGGAGVAAAQTDTSSGSGSTTNEARRHHPRRHAIRIAARASADTIGVTVEELREAVRGGQTVAAFAESKGVDPDQVEQAIVAALTEAIDRAVSTGRISEERAAALEERLPTFADRFVHHEPKQQASETQPTAI